jgi:hydrogenase-4 component E
MAGPLLAAAAAPPAAFDGAAQALSVVVLLTAFVMLRQALVRSQVLVYALQSLAVVAVTGALAASQHAGGLYALAGLSFVLKVVVVPAVILHLLSEAEVDLASSQRFRVATLVLVGICASVFAFIAVGQVHVRGAVEGGLPVATLSTAAATVLVSFVVVAARADVVSQVVGFFSMENGVSLASLVVAARMPVILEVGFLFDLLVAALAFAVIMRAHHRRAASLSTETLDQLRG